VKDVYGNLKFNKKEATEMQEIPTLKEYEEMKKKEDKKEVQVKRKENGMIRMSK
jgi:hypothetical protein